MTGAQYRLSSPPPRGLHANAMPASFGDPGLETASCREHAALFDYSFLLRLVVRGPGALAGVSALCGRDFRSLPVGRIRYALTTDAEGWLVSDLTVWRTGADSLELMSGRAEDARSIPETLATYDAAVSDVSDDTAVLAVQGPGTGKVLAGLSGGASVSAISSFGFLDAAISGVPCTVARLGFTGLDGVEIVCPAGRAQGLWDVLARSAEPAGFEAADRLRLSAGLALFTQEFAPPVSAADAGLSRFRPDGNTPADRRPARVVRLCFSARPAASSARRGDVDVASLTWREGAPFPPAPETIAITSVAPNGSPAMVIGMGYARPASLRDRLYDPMGNFEALRVIGADL